MAAWLPRRAGSAAQPFGDSTRALGRDCARCSLLLAAALFATGAGCGGAQEGGVASAPIEAGEERPGGETTNELVFGSNAFLYEAPNASRESRRLFAGGNAFFNQSWVEGVASTGARDGLGPLFNARSCSSCHFKDGRGRPPLDESEPWVSMLLRVSRADGAGTPAPDPAYGAQLQPLSVDGVPPEGTPRVRYEPVTGEYGDGTPFELLRPTYTVEQPAHGPLQQPSAQFSPRVAPAMIGLGLLEAVDEATLLGAADPEDSNGDGISGRVNWVPEVANPGSLVLGRFGWKAEQPNVRQQNAAAFHGDMGLTSSLFPAADCSPEQPECRQAAGSGPQPEVSDDVLNAVERYAQLVAVPARRSYAEPKVLRGKALFGDLGCGSCHTPRLRTGVNHSLEEVQGQAIWPYTDLLLHDMGEALSDHRPSFAAAGAEWRTPPLWGLGFYPAVNDHERLLHDGRARGVAEAVLWHGGEAEPASEGFRLLPGTDREALVAFVESL